jgi:hypothetical protein
MRNDVERSENKAAPEKIIFPKEIRGRNYPKSKRK